MLRLTKIVFIVLVLFSTGLSAVADKGVGKKARNKTFSLSFNNNYTLRSSLNFNLKSGLTYKGSRLGLANSGNSGSTVTYQRGNNVYIIPYRQKVAVPEVRQGYAGFKLILRAN